MANGNSLEWSNVNYKVATKVKKGYFNPFTTIEEHVILNNVKGKIKSGSLTAVLGASGCGKTTLLAALSQRLRGDVSGTIKVNGEIVDRGRMTQISGFVPQSDISVDALTVLEHFYFMMELKLPDLENYEKKNILENSLTQFGLTSCGDTKIRFLSGGEKRKLSLATELLIKPKILFCDEPTSGLDSYNAFSVMKTLRLLAGTNGERKLFQKTPPKPSKIVVFSIHQPTSEIFQLFTNIILMNAGQIIFHGTVDEAQTLFSNMGFNLPERFNPADYYVRLISDPKQSGEIARKALLGLHTAEAEEPPRRTTESHDAFDIPSKLSWLHQVSILSQRSILSFRRDTKSYLFELMIFIMFACIVTSVYSGISIDSETSVQDIRGFLMILGTEVLFTFTYAVLFSLCSELPLLRKETGDHLYSLSAYYVSQVFINIPRVFFETFLFTAICYFSMDIGRDFGTFLSITLSLSLSGVCAMSYGFLLSGIFESIRVSTELSGIIDLVLLLFAGMYINVKSLSYFKYLSFFFYANETIAINFWSKVEDIKCNPDPQAICFANGTHVLQEMGFATTQSALYTDYILQFVLTVITHVCAYLGTRRNVRKTGFY
ncbi:unnamed protein product [Diamesa tonsa]